MTDIGKPRDEWAATVAGTLRRECPAVDRLCSPIRQVYIDAIGVAHTDADCDLDAEPHDMRVGDLCSTELCVDCADLLVAEVDDVAQLLSELGDLFFGPKAPVGREGAVPLFGGAAALATSTVAFELELRGVTRWAAECEAMQLGLDSTIDQFIDPERGELLDFVRDLNRRWGARFATEGAEELRLLNRLAGPDAIVTQDGFRSVLRFSDYAVGLREQLAVPVFNAFAGAYIGGEKDPVAAAANVLAADERLRVPVPVSASAEDLRVLLEEVKDLVELNDRVRALRRSEAFHAVLAAISERVLPAPAVEGWQLVISEEWSWERMFWWDAIYRCFPAQFGEDHVAVALPDGLAERVVASIRSMDTRAGVWVSPLPDDESERMSVFATVVALLGDGLAPDAVRDVAVAVNR